MVKEFLTIRTYAESFCHESHEFYHTNIRADSWLWLLIRDAQLDELSGLQLLRRRLGGHRIDPNVGSQFEASALGQTWH